MGLFNRTEKYKKVNSLPELPQVQPLQAQTQVYRQPVIPSQFNQARIVAIEESEDGEFTYKVVTNYQLNLGNCQINN